jgi:hypothetical protein
MKKKPMVLLTICILFVAVASLLLYTLRPTGQAQKQNPTLTSTNSLVEDYASIGEILQDPSAWVNKTVVVEGNLSGFFLYSPEDMDWSYKLSSDEWTIGVAHISIGDYSSAPARVYGLVRERARYPYPFWHGGRYYIEAEKIELL